MGSCQSTNLIQSKQKLSQKQIQKLNLKPLTKNLQQKYSRYRKQHRAQSSQNSDLITLQQQIRNIYMGLIKEKIMLANESKITMKQCKIQISQQILSVQLTVLKYVEHQLKAQQDVDLIKNFYSNMGSFLVTLARFLKTIYPRGENVQAGQLAKEFKEFDNTEEYEFDILKNAGVVFSSPNQFDITNTIKLFLNKIMDEIDTHFGSFYSMIQKIDHSFKIGRKISENTSRYVKLDTGTVQIKSTQVARVLIKWMQDLSQTLNFAQQKITAKNEYKFYKTFQQTGRIQFSKCQQQTMTKILNGGLIYCLDQQKNQAKKKADQRKSKFRKFNMHLVQIFNEVEHRQSQVSRQMMEIIKYSSFNNSFIAWMVEEQLIQSIIHLIQASNQYQEFRGVLDLIKFKINDLMRCQIFGDRKKIMAVYRQFQRLQSEDIIQIIKIKNRFSTPMSDAMLFFKLPKSFIVCQCQLILSQQSKGQDAKKAKNIETLNHFLYELERSPFGVLGQISVFLTAKSQTVSSYCQKINLSLTDSKKIDVCIKQHGSHEKKGKQKFKQQKSPFVCSKCLLFFKKFQNKLKTHYCQKCIIFLCNACMGQKFEITDDMITTTITQKLQTCQQEIKKTRLYRQNTHTFDQAFSKITPKELIENCFIKKKINEVNIIKQSFKNNKIKVSAIIDYIHSKEDYVKIYMEKGVKVNFVIITWRGQETRLKCYRYDNDEGCILNVFQPIEKYETHEFIEVNDYDIFAEFLAAGFCGINEKNKDRTDGFDLKVRSMLERGLYVFEGQTKQTMVSIVQSIQDQQRHKYLLKSYSINDDLHLIIDIDHSLKRSDEADKIKQYLNQISNNSQQKKSLKMTDMNITNAALKNLYDHSKWTKNVKNLIISDNNISSIGTILQLCKNLEKLNISRNRFNQLRFKSALPSLVQLDASQNSIQRIINLYNVRKIQILNLRSNKLSHLTRWVDGAKKKSIKSIKNLLPGKSGDHSHNQASEKSFFASIFTVCQTPTAQQTGFDNIEFNDDQGSDDEYDMVQVKSLAKDQNGAYIYLRQLLLANNNFQSMKEFAQGYFPNLTYLDMSDNLVEEIPQLNLDKIQQIHLPNNCIKKLDKFAKFDNSSLAYLDLKNNKITEIPKFNFHLLTKVDFSYNSLQKNSQFITGDYFQNLSHLYFSHIRIENLGRLPKSVKVLSIESCQIVDQQLEKFIKQLDLPKLRQLYLTRNKLTKLPNIEPLQKITALFLEENPISDISILETQQREQKVKSLQQIKVKQKQKKKKQQQPTDNKSKQIKKMGLYYYVTRLWISLHFQDNKQFNQTKQKLQNYLVNTKIVCWKYDSIFGQTVQKPKRKFLFLQQNQTVFKQLMIKRLYLLNVFESQAEINNRFQLQEQGGMYTLEHQWDNIDMNEFIKYDWNEIQFLDLRGTGMDDKKWKVLVDNANLFPALKEIQIWQHKITTIHEGDLQKFTQLQKISFCTFLLILTDQSNAWSNPLSKQSKQILKKFRHRYSKVIVKYQEQSITNPKHHQNSQKISQKKTRSLRSQRKKTQTASQNSSQLIL